MELHMATVQKDAYDFEIDYLMTNPERAEKAWIQAGKSDDWLKEIRGWLFRHCDTDLNSRRNGCLTQLKGGWGECDSAALLVAIKTDKLIPPSWEALRKLCEMPNSRRHILEHFADWQRRADLELGRPAPPLPQYLINPCLET